MLEAAHRLFVEQGYAATSVRQIADEARVGEQTVYRVFEDKAALLREVLLATVSGGDRASVARDMEDFMSDVAAAQTPHERIRVVAAWSAGVYQRDAADLEEVVFAGAAADPRVEELSRFIKEQRHQDIKALVPAVVGDTGPPAGMTFDEIADFVYAVWSSPVYRMLVKDRGWSLEKYIDWCVLMVERMFLDRLGNG
jgi:AcrR family transcriptional regulator